jgi:hypothetical protein
MQPDFEKIESMWRFGSVRIVAAVAVFLAFSSLFSVNARAACSVSNSPKLDLALPPELEERTPAQQSPEADSESSAHESHPAITGLWFVTLYSGGVAFDQGFDAWHSDGTEILNDNGPPEPPWSTGAICLGVWKQTGHNIYKLRHPGWNFDGGGNLSAIVLILEKITLDADGNRYRGTFELNLYDPVTKKLISQTTGELKAHRIRVD